MSFDQIINNCQAEHMLALGGGGGGGDIQVLITHSMAFLHGQQSLLKLKAVKIILTSNDNVTDR